MKASSSLPSSPLLQRKRVMSSAGTTSSKYSLPKPDLQPDAMPKINENKNAKKYSQKAPPVGNGKISSHNRVTNKAHLPPANANTTNGKKDFISKLEPRKRIPKAISTDSVFNEALERERHPTDDPSEFSQLASLSFVDALQHIPKMMNEIMKNKNLLTETVHPAFTVMKKYCKSTESGGELPQELANIWIKTLMKNGVSKLYRRFWDQFWTQAELHKWVAKKFTQVEAKRALEYFDTLNDCLVNSTDDDAGLCEQLIKLHFAKDFVKALEIVIPLSADLNKNGIDKVNPLRLSIITISSNILRLCPTSDKEFRDEGAVAVFINYMNIFADTHNNEMKAILACSIAYTVHEDDIAALKVAASAISVLVGIELKDATSKPSRRSEEGFCVGEILQALNALASVDSVKLQLMENKAHFHVLADTYKQENSWEELILISQLFWTLSFDEKLRKHILEWWPGFIRHLQRIEPSSRLKMVGNEKSNETVLNNAKGTLWNFGEKGPNCLNKPGSPKQSKVDNKTNVQVQGHVMISYDWKHQPLVLRLNKHLRSEGINTWIDVEQMSGSTLDAMAEAVQQSSVVVICLSEKYKESPNCRAEAEYAFRLNKPIIPVKTQAGYKADGWLGMLVGTKLYFNCSDKARIQESAPKLLTEIRKNMKSEDRSASSSKSTNTKSASRSSSSKRSSLTAAVVAEDIRSYNTEQVLAWLEKNNLADLKTPLHNFDGGTLHRLYEVFKTSPQAVLSLKLFQNVPETFKLINCLEQSFHES